MQSISGAERAALCDLFDELGPDAPTLCEGWTTSDLAAHLYVRERRPDAAPGVLFRPLAGYNAKTMSAVLKHHGYAGVVQKVRGGPPLPLRPFDSQMNTLEYFVHHEDVRRAAEDWEPRWDRELDAALWKVLRRAAWMLSRQLKGAHLDLVRSDGETIKGRAGEPRVAIKGGPQELGLYLFGRTKVARVTIEGDEPGRAALERASFGV